MVCYVALNVVVYIYFLTVCRRRESAVRKMLCLHCSLEETEESMEKEQFLTEKLLIPIQWIHQAKAIRACREGDKHREALHLYKAGYWNHCHRLVIQHLASGLNIFFTFYNESIIMKT